MLFNPEDPILYVKNPPGRFPFSINHPGVKCAVILPEDERWTICATFILADTLNEVRAAAKGIIEFDGGHEIAIVEITDFPLPIALLSNSKGDPGGFVIDLRSSMPLHEEIDEFLEDPTSIETAIDLLKKASISLNPTGS